ncbi:MAG: hypothetical protein PVI90_00210 [Desulfobacteraceae bacterium]|jgi:hypothetical protein
MTAKDFRIKPKLDTEGRTRSSIEPRKDAASVLVVSYNWCDKCTWYQNSIRKTGQTLTLDSGTTYKSDISNWIDLTHGRLYREDLVSSNYLVKVYDNGVELTQRTSFTDSGGDYTVDYKNGKITLATAPSGPVTADFSHENGSLFTIAPTAGKCLWVEESEVQFSTNIILNDTVHFQAFATNPYDPEGPKIPVTSKTTYKTAGDYVDEARGVYPSVPAFGGSTRGLLFGHLVFPFKYLQLQELLSSMGLEIRIWLENDIEFGGERATGTFYCTSKDENT